jgi:ketosteroid isomerase-like protein
MRVPVVLAAVIVALALAGCGSSDTDQVQATLDQFAHAVATRDAKPICDRVLAPQLVAKLEGVGLNCEYAIDHFFFSCRLRHPTITVGHVAVSGDTAKALVYAGAKGQPGGIFAIGLVKTSQGWRVASESAEKKQPRGSCSR